MTTPLSREIRQRERSRPVTKKLLPLESLRGISAILVAVFHSKIHSHINNSSVQGAWLLVDFFFVLSGFVIALNYAERIATWKNLLAFQKRRLLRLYPLHVATLFLSLANHLAAQTFTNLRAPGSAQFSANPHNDLSSFLATAMLLQAWIIPYPCWNFPSWSVSTEFYTYAIFGLLAYLCPGHRRKMAFLAVAVLITTAAALSLTKTGMSELPPVAPIRCLYSFFLGTLTCEVYTHFKTLCLRTSFHSIALLALTAVAVSKYATRPSSPEIITLPVLFAVCILSISLTSNAATITRILSAKPLVYLGTISYGVYLIHPFAWKATRLATGLLGAGAVNHSREATLHVLSNSWAGDAMIAAGLAITIAAAHASFYFYEALFTAQRSPSERLTATADR